MCARYNSNYCLDPHESPHFISEHANNILKEVGSPPYTLEPHSWQHESAFNAKLKRIIDKYPYKRGTYAKFIRGGE